MDAPPDFSELTLSHRAEIIAALAADPPQASELTFTNLFIWRDHYQPAWGRVAGCVVLLLRPRGGEPFCLQPFGPGEKPAALTEAVRLAGSVRRADQAFVDRWVDPVRYEPLLDRDNSDYVYLSADLINLAGRRYEKKRGHLSRFRRHYRHDYQPLTRKLIDRVLQMQEAWCRLRDCPADAGLADEDRAVSEALTNFEALGLTGGAILIDDRVEAFALGERLNPETAVIHIEKANPEIVGLYAAINQAFAQAAWAGVKFINREQDLGLEGLRRAKESYVPDHLAHKYVVRTRA